MNPFSEELATFAVSHQLFGVGYRGRPVKPCPESLSDQCLGGYMVATGSGMYVLEEFYAIVLGDTLHQNFCACILVHELAVDQ
jgi:hypothetical protein